MLLPPFKGNDVGTSFAGKRKTGFLSPLTSSGIL
jgi:hypothetical protein